MNPLRRLAATLSHWAYKAQGRGLSLVANWLANVLWNIDTTWTALVKETYGTNVVAYACVRLLSQSIPEARLTAYTGEGDKRKELPPDHPLRQLFKQPNELMTRFEMDELTTIQMSVVGRSVWWKERSVGGAPIALWPLRPDRVGPVYSTSDRPSEKVLAGWAYQSPDMTQPVLIPRRDAISFNFPDPDGQSGGIVEGFGPLCAARSQIAADNKATQHVGALLANYAQPGIAIRVTDSVPDEDTANLIKAKFKQEFGGARLGMPALLDAGADITPFGFTLKDLEFPELRANAEARITAATGTPAILVGVKVGLDRATYSNAQEARAFFAETTLSWYWRRYADQFTNDLAPDFGEDITCEYDTSKVRALAGQKIEALTPIKEAWLNGGAMRSEYRAALGLDPLDPELGEVLFLPNSGTVVPATEKARQAIQKRQEQEQAKLAEQQAVARQAELDQQAELAKLNPPPEVPQLTAGQPEQDAPLFGAKSLKHGGAHAGHGGAHAGPALGPKKRVDGVQMRGDGAEVWAELPEGVRKGAAQAGLKEFRLVDDAEMERQAGRGSVKAGTVALYSDDGILLISKSSPDVKESLLHEVAHAYDPMGPDGKYAISEGSEWLKAGGWKAGKKPGSYKLTQTIYNRPVSRYGTTSPWEDFATSWSKFLGGTSFDRRVMQGESEGRYLFLQKLARDRFGMELKAVLDAIRAVVAPSDLPPTEAEAEAEMADTPDENGVQFLASGQIVQEANGSRKIVGRWDPAEAFQGSAESEKSPEPAAVGANGHQAAGRGPGGQGPLPPGPARKAGEIVVIPLDEELAAALGVPATGYLVAGDGNVS